MAAEYHLAKDGIFEPTTPVQHRDDEYPEDGFATLWAMQERHFWYRGRHRFLLHALDRYRASGRGPLAAVDLGGVGGWVRYLAIGNPGSTNHWHWPTPRARHCAWL